MMKSIVFSVVASLEALAIVIGLNFNVMACFSRFWGFRFLFGFSLEYCGLIRL